MLILTTREHFPQLLVRFNIKTKTILLILKIHDGRIWMVRASESISDSMDGHKDLRKISFNWVEIGDVNDMKTLYMNGFSDVGSRWWQ